MNGYAFSINKDTLSVHEEALMESSGLLERTFELSTESFGKELSGVLKRKKSKLKKNIILYTVI